jgi:putative DNA primase/helicase
VAVRDEDIPDALRRRPQWLTWRYHRKGNKWTKLPVAAATGKVCDATDPRTWSPFDQALAYYRAHRARVDGVSYAFSNDDPFSGVDLDDALDPDSGAVRDWAEPILAGLNSYAETSPSSTGVKVFLRGKLPADARRHRKSYGGGEVEIYDRKRFFVVTGHRLADCPPTVEDRQPQLESLYRLVFGEEDQTRGTPPTEPTGGKRHTPLDDAALLDKAMNAAHGDRFRRLWTGDTSDHDNDASRADLALCCALAFWTGGDARRMDAQFRASGLMRRKWDEPRGDKTYGQRTFDRALARVGDFYTPGNLRGRATTTAAGGVGTTGTEAEGEPGAAGSLPHDAAAEVEPPGYRFRPVTSADFDAADYRETWRVKRLLVAHQPTILGAPYKTLKTTLAVDLALSLGTGTPFLGTFEVCRPARVGTISGESGGRTLQETARRVCAAKGVKLAGADVLWDFDLPHLADARHVEELREGVEARGIEVLILDPLYLCVLAGDGGRSLEASNLFHMGPLFRALARALRGAGCEPVLLHHAPKHVPAGKPLELDQLAYAGVTEFARQWLLLNRREAFDPSAPGSHRLWLSAGGSSGQCGQWALDIEEGELREDFSGRGWEVTVRSATEVRSQAAARKRDSKQQGKEQSAQRDEARVLSAIDALAQDNKQATQNAIRLQTGLSGDRASAVLARLLDQGLLEDFEVTVKSGKNTNMRATAFRPRAVGSGVHRVERIERTGLGGSGQSGQ